ncbi:MAG: hypothetical protein LBN02_02605 [Oscillospiraceae bacterium]|jgi:hypothetical protein|nr:hypothetical protein [Oscillospiraceae bacterium]
MSHNHHHNEPEKTSYNSAMSAAAVHALNTQSLQGGQSFSISGAPSLGVNNFPSSVITADAMFNAQRNSLYDRMYGPLFSNLNAVGSPMNVGIASTGEMTGEIPSFGNTQNYNTTPLSSWDIYQRVGYVPYTKSGGDNVAPTAN